MRRLPVACVPLVASIVAGCGTRVPSMQPYQQKYKEDYVAESLKEGRLIDYLKCSLTAAVQYQIIEDAKPGSPPDTPMNWLKTWGAEINLKVTVDEKSTLAPGIVLASPMENVISMFRTGGNVVASQSFNLGIGASVSADATRVETVSFFYPFIELIGNDPLGKDRLSKETCGSNAGDDAGTIEGDLKIDDFMKSKLEMARTPGLLRHKTGVPDDGSVSPFDTFTYQTTFVVITSGNLTPTWKLVRISANPSGPFASAVRTRTDDLTITMSKAVTVDNTPQLSQQGQIQLQATLIGQAVASALRNQQQQ